MKPTVLIISLLLLLLLAACATTVKVAKPIIKEPAQAEQVTEPAPEQVQEEIQETPKHECALLEIEEGHKMCGTELQVSGMKQFDGRDFSCTQTFIHKELPHDKVVIKVMDYLTQEEAQDKYEWDLKVLQGIESDEITNMFWIPDQEANRYEFVRGKYVGRISELPPAACQDLESFIPLVVKRLTSKAQGLR